MNDLVYPKERTLGAITLVLGVLAWLGLIAGTFGVALIVVALGFVAYLFIQSTLISHIKGNGVELTPEQFPDLYAEFVACCEQLKMSSKPEAYVLYGNGGLNAFATRFLGRQYVVLLSDVVDAMNQNAGGLRFYIGHELGHLRMKHLTGHLLRWPVLWLPLIGAAYSRARESTCDRHGLACSGSPDAAAQALAALSAGPEGWKKMNMAAYRKQLEHSAGFWMSFHELTSGYPWLTKRVARVLEPHAELPRRSAGAYLLALFVPYAGRLGGGFGILITIYIIGILAAIAIPAYQDYTAKAGFSMAIHGSQNVREALVNHYQKTGKIPDSLAALGVAEQLADGSRLELDPRGMVLTVTTQRGALVFVPSADENGRITWECTPGEGVRPTQVPATCRARQGQ